MAEGFKKYKRTEWWREAGEVSDKERRMTEASAKKEAYTLKKGSDGKNTPPVTSKYAKKSSGKKKVSETKLVAKKYEEAFGEDEDMFDDQDEGMGNDLDMDSEEGINSEDEIPMDAEDEVGGHEESICTCPACGAKLVIETVPDEEMEDEGMEGEEDEGMEGEDGMDSGMDVESEEDDMTVPKLESKYKDYSKKVEAKKNAPVKNTEESFEEAYKKWKAERAARLEAVKAKTAKTRKAEAKSEIGVEYGSETADMASDGITSSGVKTKVGKGNDDDFGIAPTDTDMVASGKTSSGSKSSISASGGSRTAEKRKQVKKPMAEEEAATTDPFEDQDDLDGMVDGDDFANIPTDVGAESDQIEHYEAVQKRRKNRDLNESTASKSSFDFKKLVRGEYK